MLFNSFHKLNYIALETAKSVSKVLEKNDNFAFLNPIFTLLFRFIVELDHDIDKFVDVFSTSYPGVEMVVFRNLRHILGQSLIRMV